MKKESGSVSSDGDADAWVGSIKKQRAVSESPRSLPSFLFSQKMRTIEVEEGEWRQTLHL